MHSTPLIATLVGGLCIAFVFGAIAFRLRIPPLAGYLLAGIVVGPFTPGYVADQALAPELAEIGVILLMFGVGLHFSLKDLLSVKNIAIPGAIVQIAFATFLGYLLAKVFGWHAGAGIVFGLSLSVASTVVLLRALQDQRILDSDKGRIAVGWLIVEDLVMVLALVLLPPFASILGGPDSETVSTGALVWTLTLTLLKVCAFVAVMLIVGRRVIPWILQQIAKTGSKELFTLAVLAIALGVAFGSAAIFGVSFALGAFFAGMILGESELSHDAAEDILPLRDAFSVLFFVSVGMLFNPTVLITSPLAVLATFVIIVVGKALAAFVIVKLFRHSTDTALTISASLAQIGEFSFILAGLGMSLGLLPQKGQDLILAGAILSIVLNPVVFFLARRYAKTLNKPRTRSRDEEPNRTTAGALEGAFPGGIGDPTLPTDATSSSMEVSSGQAGRAQRASVGMPPGVALDNGAKSTENVTEAAPDGTPAGKSRHVVIVGFGRVGSEVAKALGQRQIAFVVVDDRVDNIDRLREAGVTAVLGSGVATETLIEAGVPSARFLIVSIPNAFEAAEVIRQAKALCPTIHILARAHNAVEQQHLEQHGAHRIVLGQVEIARGMADYMAHAH